MRRVFLIFVATGALLALPRIAVAHAHLVSSAPAANATVQGPNIPIELQFNSRVDSVHSTLAFVTQNGSVTLVRDTQRTPTTLNAHAKLKPGSYTLKWQALSTDGHITRGEIPFSVR